MEPGWPEHPSTRDPRPAHSQTEIQIAFVGMRHSWRPRRDSQSSLHICLSAEATQRAAPLKATCCLNSVLAKKKKQNKNNAEISTTNIRQLNTICHRYTVGGVRILCVYVFGSQTHSLRVVRRLERHRCCLGGGQGHGRAGGKNLDGGGESQEGERWGWGTRPSRQPQGHLKEILTRSTTRGV